jgi:hypothetical protein
MRNPKHTLRTNKNTHTTSSKTQTNKQTNKQHQHQHQREQSKFINKNTYTKQQNPFTPLPQQQQQQQQHPDHQNTPYTTQRIPDRRCSRSPPGRSSCRKPPETATRIPTRTQTDEVCRSHVVSRIAQTTHASKKKKKKKKNSCAHGRDGEWMEERREPRRATATEWRAPAIQAKIYGRTHMRPTDSTAPAVHTHPATRS